MSDNVVKLSERLEIVGDGYRFDPQQILEAAKGFPFEKLAVLGVDENGELWVSGNANAGEIMILMEKAKKLIVWGES
jgi:hypothetical protein